MNKPKVLQVIGGMNVGGTETMIMNIYRKVHQEVQFDFISYYDFEAYYDKEIEDLGGRVIRLQLPSKRGAFGTIKDLRKVIKEENYSAVHCHTLFHCGIGVLAAKLGGTKIRISHAHTTADDSMSFLKKVYIGLMRQLIRMFSTNLLACSHVAGKYLYGDKLVQSPKYKILPNYIDYEKFLHNEECESIKKELGLKKDDIIITHIGRFIGAKNHKFLIDLIGKLVRKNSKIKCLLVGDGDFRLKIEEKVKSMNLESNVIFLGIRKDIDKILKETKLFILPSTFEGLGLVLLEAQASGVPCLASTAIQPEADLGLGILKQLSLDSDLSLWEKSALKMMKTQKLNKADIRKAFEERGYKVEDIVEAFTTIYGLSEGVNIIENERYIDSLL